MCAVKLVSTLYSRTKDHPNRITLERHLECHKNHRKKGRKKTVISQSNSLNIKIFVDFDFITGDIFEQPL